MIRLSVFGFASLLLLTNGLFAQSIDFLPVGIFSSSLEISSSRVDSILMNRTRSESLTQRRLKVEGLDPNDVSGSMSVKETTRTLRVLYGLTKSINIGINVPYRDRDRESNLLGNTPNGSLFAKKYQPAHAHGIGDIEILTLWRLNYSDYHDFLFGFSLNGDNASTNFDDDSVLPLGSGAQELSTWFRWKIYDDDSTLVTEISLKTTFTKDITIKTPSGEELEFKKDSNLISTFFLSANRDAFHFGGGVSSIMETPTIIDGNTQGDEFISHTLTLFLTYGNLNQLESTYIQLPMEISMYLKNTIMGDNAPANKKIGINASLYF